MVFRLSASLLADNLATEDVHNPQLYEVVYYYIPVTSSSNYELVAGCVLGV